jgi:hypothetical protein
MQKQEIRAERRSQAILRKRGLIASQMARLLASLAEPTGSASQDAKHITGAESELETRNPTRRPTGCKQVRYRY